MRIDHVAIACRDVETQRKWYEEVLGVKVAGRKPAPSRPGVTEAAYLVGPPGNPTTIELMPDDDTAPVSRKPFAPGLSHLALAIDDFDAWEARLTRAGVSWLGPVGEAISGGRLRSFLDPEGNMLQIVERR